MNDSSKHPILLYDGDCNFCRACVRWTLRRDRRGIVRFAALQSAAGSRLLMEYGLPPDFSESVVFIDEEGAHLRSEGVLRLFGCLRGGWRLLAGLRILPRFARDFGYDLVSRNRSGVSRAAGTIDHRWEPPPRYRDRFLGDT